MKQVWLKRDGSTELLVVMTGWAVGSEPFRHLTGTADVLMLSDYRELEPWQPPAAYAEMDLVAYSFGVAAACQWPSLAGFRRKVAICGSWAPYDDELGIPRAAMQATADNLSETSLQAFAQQAACAVAPGADLSNLQAELEAVMQRQPGTPHDFDRVVQGRADRIFPLQNLSRAWAAQAPESLRRLRCGHNPFALWNDWADVFA